MESWIWLIVALVTLALEVATPAALISIWFSIGALFAYVAALLNLGLLVEVLVFIIMSVVSFLGVRPFRSEERRVGKNCIYRWSPDD